MFLASLNSWNASIKLILAIPFTICDLKEVYD